MYMYTCVCIYIYICIYIYTYIAALPCMPRHCVPYFACYGIDNKQCNDITKKINKSITHTNHNNFACLWRCGRVRLRVRQSTVSN